MDFEIEKKKKELIMEASRQINTNVCYCVKYCGYSPLYINKMGVFSYKNLTFFAFIQAYNDSNKHFLSAGGLFYD